MKRPEMYGANHLENLSMIDAVDFDHETAMNMLDHIRALQAYIEHLEAPADDAMGRELPELFVSLHASPGRREFQIASIDGVLTYEQGTEIIRRAKAPAASVDLEAVKAKLEAIAKLGNGDKYGNSEGNVLALEALAILSGGKL